MSEAAPPRQGVLRPTDHALLRWEQRVQAYMSKEEFLRKAEEALEYGHPIDLKQSDPRWIRFARLYCGWCFIYGTVDYDADVRLVTVLPMGARPGDEIVHQEGVA